jgi:hypothetical protein
MKMGRAKNTNTLTVTITNPKPVTKNIKKEKKRRVEQQFPFKKKNFKG